MGEIRDQFSYVYRDFVTEGIPSSGLREVEKADVRALGGVIEDEVAVYAIAAANSASQALQAATAAQGTVHTLTTSVSAGGSLPFEVSALSGSFVGTGTGGTPGEYALVVSGGPAGHTAFITIGGDGKMASARIGARGIATANTAPTYALPSGSGLTGATLPAATVSAIPAGRVFLAPNANSGATLLLGWIVSGGVIAAWNLGGVQWAEYLKGSIDAFAASSEALNRDTARIRREHLSQETFGEPETLVLRNGGIDYLLRQVLENGLHLIPGGIQVEPPSLVQAWADFQFAISLNRGSDRVAPFAIDWDGNLELHPNTATYYRIKQWLADNGGGANAFVPLADLRGDYSAYPGFRIWPIGTKAGQVAVQAQDRGGQTYRAFESVAGTTNLAVIEGPAKMGCAIYIGQSPAGKSGDSTTLDQEAHFPATAFSFATVNQIFGSDGTNTPAWIDQTELAPLRNLNSDGQLPMVTVELALAQFRCDHGIAQQGDLAFTSWKGGTSLAEMDKTGSTNTYQNTIAQLENAEALIQNHERTGLEVQRFWLSQGETSSVAGWAVDFASIKANYTADVATVTGQASPGQWFITQSNTVYGAFNSNYLAQNAVHDAGSAIMTSSGINLPLAADDGIHPTAIGTMIRGDQDAHAIACWERDGVWHPPREISAIRSGLTLTLRVQLPRDTTAFGKVLDGWSPPQVTQDGFRITSGSGDVAITSIAYSIDPATGDGIVTMVLAGTPGSTPKLRYGIDYEGSFSAGAPTDPPVWPSRTGNVMATQAQRSFWQRAGYDVPAFVKQPLRRFEINIT